jgi:hypothetical protein
MRNHIKPIAASFLFLLMIVVWIVARQFTASNVLISGLGQENAATTERWIFDTAQQKLEAALPGLERGVGRSGGKYGSESSPQFEILSAKDIYWRQEVAAAKLHQVIAELDALPELQTWTRAGADLHQQRKVEFRVVGSPERPIFRILFLCSNLPAGQSRNEGFLTNMWP